MLKEGPALSSDPDRTALCPRLFLKPPHHFTFVLLCCTFLNNKITSHTLSAQNKKGGSFSSFLFYSHIFTFLENHNKLKKNTVTGRWDAPAGTGLLEVNYT